jgi:hypothetical protein
VKKLRAIYASITTVEQIEGGQYLQERERRNEEVGASVFRHKKNKTNR